MADEPTDNKSGAPVAEELKPQEEGATPAGGLATPPPQLKARSLKRGSYRPSHKATFIGLAVVVLILAINAAIVAFVLKSQSKLSSQASQGQVTINQDALDKLGVNRTAVGDAGIELTVNPNAKFNGNLQVGGDVSVGGQLKTNGKFSATSASFTQLEAGKTSLSQLNVNGDGTLSNLNLRKNLIVTGTSTLQGSTTFSQLVTASSGLNVGGNLAVGGTLSVGAFNIGTLTVSGHLLTSGSTPTRSCGNIGSSGTCSISGNDSAGTVNVNTGGGGASGTLIYVTFSRAYARTPHVVVSPVGSLDGSAGSVYVTRTTSGFSIGISGSVPASRTYEFDYIIEQ